MWSNAIISPFLVVYLTGHDDGCQPGQSPMKVYRLRPASASNGRKRLLTTKTTKDNNSNSPQRHRGHREQQEFMGTATTAKTAPTVSTEQRPEILPTAATDFLRQRARRTKWRAQRTAVAYGDSNNGKTARTVSTEQCPEILPAAATDFLRQRARRTKWRALNARRRSTPCPVVFGRRPKLTLAWGKAKRPPQGSGR